MEATVIDGVTIGWTHQLPSGCQEDWLSGYGGRLHRPSPPLDRHPDIRL
jgi:hypothetical protein